MKRALPILLGFTCVVVVLNGCGGGGGGTPSPITPTITWPAPAAITYGTALSSTQLNATANLAGTFAYTPTAGTVLTAGSHTLGHVYAKRREQGSICNGDELDHGRQRYANDQLEHASARKCGHCPEHCSVERDRQLCRRECSGHLYLCACVGNGDEYGGIADAIGRVRAHRCLQLQFCECDSIVERDGERRHHRRRTPSPTSRSSRVVTSLESISIPPNKT